MNELRGKHYTPDVGIFSRDPVSECMTYEICTQLEAQ